MDRVLFAQLTKLDAEKRLVFGRAVQEVPDRSGEIFDYATSKPYFEAWSKSQSEASMGKSCGNVREMHKAEAAGMLVPSTGLIFNDVDKAIDVCAHVVDDAAWAKCLSGVYTGFSIGGKYAKKWEDTELKKTRYTADPSEFSLVDRPCIPTCTFFEVQKADGVVEKVEFKKPAEEQVEKPKFNRREAVNELVLKGVDAKLLVGMTNETMEEIMVKHAKDETIKLAIEEPKLDPTLEVLGTEDDIAAFGKFVNEKKISMKDALNFVQIGMQKKDAPIKGNPSKEVVKTTYGAVKFADVKNKKYPLDTEEQVRSSFSYWGVTKNQAAYTADEQKVITQTIDEAVKKFGLTKVESFDSMVKTVTDVLSKTTKPENMEEMTKRVRNTMLRKGLYGCSSFAQAIGGIVSLMQSCEYEAAAEGDNSPVPGRLNAAIKMLGDILVEMVQEEISEATSAGEGATVDLGGSMVAMADGIKDMVKRAEYFAKAGRRNSKADQETIQAVHDHSNTLGATCASKDDGSTMKSDPQKAAFLEFCKVQGLELSEEQMKKLAPEEPKGVQAAPSVEMKKLQDDNAEMRKRLDDQAVEMKKVQDQLAIVASQPARTSITLRAIGKGDDISSEIANQTKIEPIRKADGTVDDLATAVKAAQTKRTPLLGT